MNGKRIMSALWGFTAMLSMTACQFVPDAARY